MSPIPSRTLTARIAGRLRAAALVALLLTHIPPALAQSPAVGLAAPITLAQPEPPARTLPAAAGVTASNPMLRWWIRIEIGRTDPGETLRYTVVVSNSSGADLAGVTFDDTLDPNTSAGRRLAANQPAGLWRQLQHAIRDTPLAIGRRACLPTIPARLRRQSLPRSVTTAAGGTATINADGSFSYTPPPGYTGIDSFSYSATNSAGSDTGRSRWRCALCRWLSTIATLSCANTSRTISGAGRAGQRYRLSAAQRDAVQRIDYGGRRGDNRGQWRVQLQPAGRLHRRRYICLYRRQRGRQRYRHGHADGRDRAAGPE